MSREQLASEPQFPGRQVTPWGKLIDNLTELSFIGKRDELEKLLNSTLPGEAEKILKLLKTKFIII